MRGLGFCKAARTLCRTFHLCQTQSTHPLVQRCRPLIHTWGFALSARHPSRHFSLTSSSFFAVSRATWQDDWPTMAEQRYCVEYAKRGQAGCKKCKEKIVKGMVRIGKVVPNPFSESAGEMKEWHHVKCIFEKLERARATTKKIEDITDLEGWEELQDEDKELINKLVAGMGCEVDGIYLVTLFECLNLLLSDSLSLLSNQTWLLKLMQVQRRRCKLS